MQSQAIQAFLARKDQEEKKKKVEEVKKKEVYKTYSSTAWFSEVSSLGVVITPVPRQKIKCSCPGNVA